MDIILSIYLQKRLKRTTQALLKISAADAIETQMLLNDTVQVQKFTIKIEGYIFTIYQLQQDKFKVAIVR